MGELPPLNALRAFDHAGRHLNFRGAADEMGVTQGAVAQQVRLLEAHLGLVLFERLPKGLAFTPEGRSYHAGVSAALADLRAATKALRPRPGRAVVSVTPTFAARWLIPNLPEFTESHPDVDLRILATEKLSGFHSDGIDLAVRQGKPPFGASLQADLLFRQDIVAVASPGLVGPEATPLTAPELAGLPRLHDAHDHWPGFLNLIGAGKDGEGGLRLSQTSLAIDAALSGQGVALAARFLVARDLEEGRLVQVVSAVLQGDQDFWLLTQRAGRRGTATATVRNWLLEKAGADI